MFDEFVLLFCAFLVLFLVREFGSLCLLLCFMMSKHSQPGRIFDKSAGQRVCVFFFVLFWRFFLCSWSLTMGS